MMPWQTNRTRLEKKCKKINTKRSQHYVWGLHLLMFTNSSWHFKIQLCTSLRRNGHKLYSKVKDVNENDGPTFAYGSQCKEAPTAGCSLHPCTQLQASACSTGGSTIPIWGFGYHPWKFLENIHRCIVMHTKVEKLTARKSEKFEQ